MDAGIVGGVIGATLGIVGGAVGTYLSIKHTTGSAERSFVLRSSIVVWIACIALLIGIFFLPRSYRWIPWVLCAVFVVVGVSFANRKQAQLRQREGRHD